MGPRQLDLVPVYYNSDRPAMSRGVKKLLSHEMGSGGGRAL